MLARCIALLRVTLLIVLRVILKPARYLLRPNYISIDIPGPSVSCGRGKG